MMNKLQQLIQELCPDGVEWKTLGEVCDFQNGFAFRSDLFKDTGLPIVRITNIDGKNIDLEDVKYFDPNDYVNGNPLNYFIVKGDILIAMSGATTGKIGYYNLEETAYLNQRVGKFIPNKNGLNNRFLYHYLLSKTNFLYNLAGGGAQPNLSSNSIKEKLDIPIPPLPVQTEIVRILDKFSTLTAELQAELQARKSQYEYYEDNLLDFHDAPYYSLKDLCDIVDYRGKTPKKVTEGIFLVTAKNIRNGYIDYEKSKEYISNDDFDVVMHRGKVRKGDVLITTEAPCGNVALVDREDIALAQRVIKYRPKNMNLNNSFLKYILMGKEFQSELQATATGGTVKGIKGSKLHKLTIPLPPLAEQARIVAILDKFNTLTNSISEGLPKEIELRQKQYEYYRNMLLTFPSKNA